MLEKTPQQTAERQEASLVKNNNLMTAAETAGLNENKSTAKEAKPVYQTYIYRSYGGGYQGL